MVVHGWANRGSFSSATAVGAILWDLSLLKRSRHIYSSAGQIKGADNTISGAASILNHFLDWILLRHFALTFPHKNPWWLFLLPYKCIQQLTSVMHSKRCHRDFHPLSTKRTPPHGVNVANHANGCASQPTSKVSVTLFFSSSSSQSACTPVLCQPS